MNESASSTTYVDEFGYLCVTAANGVPFLLRYLSTGDGYGTNRLLRYSSEDGVEFYDRRYPHDQWTKAQFTGGRYFVSTLLGEGGWSTGEGGLDLGNSPDWRIDSATMDEVREWLKVKRAATPHLRLVQS